MKKNNEIFQSRQDSKLKQFITGFFFHKRLLTIDEVELGEIIVQKGLCIVRIRCFKDSFAEILKYKSELRKYLADNLNIKYTPKLEFEHINIK